MAGAVRPWVPAGGGEGEPGAGGAGRPRRFGCSLLVLGGYPTLLGTEFLVWALRNVVYREVVLVAFVDFDPYGWNIADTICVFQ